MVRAANPTNISGGGCFFYLNESLAVRSVAYRYLKDFFLRFLFKIKKFMWFPYEDRLAK